MIILRLALANIKKKKSTAITLTLLAFLAMIFLNIGLIITSEMDQFYSEKSEELNTPDFFVMTENAYYQKTFENFIFNDSRTKLAEKEEIIYMRGTENNLNSLKFGAVFFNMDTERNVAPLRIIKEDTTVPKEKAIYLPLTSEGNGAALGKEYIMTHKNTDYSFQVAGFYETPYLSGNTSGILKYFVPDERFHELYEQVGSGKIISVKLQDTAAGINEMSAAFASDFLNSTDYYASVGSGVIMGGILSSGEMEAAILSMMNVPSIVLIAFSIIICIIVLIIVHCKVIEEIEENMQNIGSLQAMGYTTVQIMLSIIAEFLIMGISGIVPGILASYMMMPAMMQFCGNVVGVIWQPGIHIVTDILGAVLILLLITASAFLGARKIRKLPPVTALRKGIHTHHFRKNMFPLQKGIGNLYFRLALKNVFSDIKQNMTTALIICVGVFSIGLALVLYANFAYDGTAVAKMTGMEISDIQLQLLDTVDAKAFQDELNTLKGVENTNLQESVMFKAEDLDTMFIVAERFDVMEVLEPMEGNYPKYDNEVVLSAMLAKELHKEIGDTVWLSSEGNTKEYYITGLSPATNNNGRMGIIGLNGTKRLSPYYKISHIDVYLEENIDADSFKKDMYAAYGVADISDVDSTRNASSDAKYERAGKKAEEQIAKLMEEHGVSHLEYAVMLDGQTILSGSSSSYKIKEITNMHEYIDGQLKSYASMMKGIVAAIVIVTMLIMVSVISITIRSLLRRKREEFGIYKALGYTTGELMKIIILNFTLTAITGSALGGIFCLLTTDSLLQIFFSQLGIGFARFIVNPLWVLGICISSVAFVIIVSMLRAYQVRKIAVYELLTD